MDIIVGEGFVAKKTKSNFFSPKMDKCIQCKEFKQYKCKLCEDCYTKLKICQKCNKRTNYLNGKLCFRCNYGNGGVIYRRDNSALMFHEHNGRNGFDLVDRAIDLNTPLCRVHWTPKVQEVLDENILNE